MPPYPRFARAWWTVSVLFMAALFSYTDRLILGALVDPIKQSLGVSDSAIGVLQGAGFALIYVLAGLFLGRIADRKHRLTILAVGALLWSFGTISCGLASSWNLMLAARIIVGTGEAALAPAAISLIADSFPPKQRGLPSGLFFIGVYVGSSISIAVGGIMLSLAQAGTFSSLPLIGALSPWRSALVLVGLSGFAIPALVLTLHEPARKNIESVLSVRAMLVRLKEDRRTLLATYLGMGVMQIGDYGMSAWMPSVLTRRFAVPPAATGEIFGVVVLIAGVLGCALGGLGSDAADRWFGIRGRLQFSFNAALAAAIGAAFISSGVLWITLTGLGFWIFCSGLAAISGIAAVQNLVPGEYRGVSMALLALCNTLIGLGVGPTIVAFITERVYGSTSSVAFAITTAALPAAIIAAALFLLSMRGAEPRGNRAFGRS